MSNQTGLNDMFKHIDAPHAYEKLQSKAATFVDNRDGHSFALGHIEGAIHLTNETVADFFSQVSKDTPVIVCCYHGNSSQQVAEFLNQQGYVDVSSLDGGFEHWRQHYPFETLV